jgi:hypothetical protein
MSLWVDELIFSLQSTAHSSFTLKPYGLIHFLSYFMPLSFEVFISYNKTYSTPILYWERASICFQWQKDGYLSCKSNEKSCNSKARIADFTHIGVLLVRILISSFILMLRSLSF